MKNAEKFKLTVRDITLIGLMVAVIEVCKIALSWAPNVELTSFWIIMFARYFGKRVFFVIPVFIVVEGAMYGLHLWWIMYIYAWPLLAVMAIIFRKSDSAVSLAVLSGIFGLMFGLLCSIPYIFIGTVDGGIGNGLRTAFAWWIAGIPWDMVHGIANFFIMMILYRPVSAVMKKTDKLLYKT